MLVVLRLAEFPELWPPDARETLSGGAVVVLEPAPALEVALDQEGVAWSRLGGSVPDGAVLVVPASPVEALILLVDRLLGPGGCPWDQAQTHESLKRHLLEEAYEVFEAIDQTDPEALREELGDLLLQPVMHGQIAETFDTQDVARQTVAKLIRRHPHVFGDADATDAEAVLRNWDRIKQAEKGQGRASLLHGVPRAMPALLRAYEISKRAARVGFEWPNVDAVWDKVREEEQELAAALAVGDHNGATAELGDLLFTLVNVARWLKIEPEEALRQMLERFTARFQAMEATANRPLGELTPAEWDELWVAAKRS